MNSTESIGIQGLEKIYPGERRGGPGVHALKPLTLRIAPGEVFGLLGPNGAGKTTLVKLLLGIVYPTAGSATIMGRNIGTVASKEMVGYLPENHRYPLYLTGDGVLRYFGRLSGLDGATLRKRADELLELVNMTKWRRTKVRKYSKGMMQRLGLAQALLNDPQVIFLDEPTDGVDPVGRKEIRDIIVRLREQGRTIFLNSHLLSEVELISDRVAILNQGELVRIGTVRELTETAHTVRIETTPEAGPRFAELAAGLGAQEIEPTSAILDASNQAGLDHAVDTLRAAGVPIAAIVPTRQTLEQLFMQIVGNRGEAR